MVLLTWDKQGTVRWLLRACLFAYLRQGRALNFTRKRIRNVEHPRAGRGRYEGRAGAGTGTGSLVASFCIILRRYLHTHLFSESRESCDRSALSALLLLHLPLLLPPLLFLWPGRVTETRAETSFAACYYLPPDGGTVAGDRLWHRGDACCQAS